jgi:hypothetical protein
VHRVGILFASLGRRSAAGLLALTLAPPVTVVGLELTRWSAVISSVLRQEGASALRP